MPLEELVLPRFRHSNVRCGVVPHLTQHIATSIAQSVEVEAPLTGEAVTPRAFHAVVSDDGDVHRATPGGTGPLINNVLVLIG